MITHMKCNKYSYKYSVLSLDRCEYFKYCFVEYLGGEYLFAASLI